MTHQSEVTYLRPESLSEAWEVLDGLQGLARPVWVSPQPPDPTGLKVEALVDLSGLDLESIEVNEGQLIIGAGARLRVIQDSEVFRQAFSGIIQRGVRKTAHQGLRNLASLGAVLLDPGSAPEFACALLAGDPELIYFDGQQHSLPLAQAWQSSSPVGLPLELRFNQKEAEESAGSIEWVGRSPMDKAILTAAVSGMIEAGSFNRIFLSVAGDGFSPQILRDTSQKLTGIKVVELDRSQLAEWVKAELDPTASYRASVDYQLEVTPILAWRALQSAFDEVE